MLLRREAERAGDTIYVDQDSGGKASCQQFQQLMRDAEKRASDLVRVFALVRFSSEGSEAVSEHTARLDQGGVAFWSYGEPMRNTTGPMAALYQAILAWAAGYRTHMKINTHQKAATTRQVQRHFGGDKLRDLPDVAGPRNGGLWGFADLGRSQQPAGVAVQSRSRTGYQFV